MTITVRIDSWPEFCALPEKEAFTDLDQICDSMKNAYKQAQISNSEPRAFEEWVKVGRMKE